MSVKPGHCKTCAAFPPSGWTFIRTETVTVIFPLEPGWAWYDNKAFSPQLSNVETSSLYLIKHVIGVKFTQEYRPTYMIILILCLNSCVPEEMTDVFWKNSEELRYEPTVEKEPYMYLLERIGMEWFSN